MVFDSRSGHKAYPERNLTTVYFYEDRFVLEEPKIVVPYGKIKDISNSNERKRHEDWLALGIIGFVAWKRNAVYTIIEYDDGVDTQKIVIDFKQKMKAAYDKYATDVGVIIPRGKSFAAGVGSMNATHGMEWMLLCNLHSLRRIYS
jgi:hypothetical protein